MSRCKNNVRVPYSGNLIDNLLVWPVSTCNPEYVPVQMYGEDNCLIPRVFLHSHKNYRFFPMFTLTAKGGDFNLIPIINRPQVLLKHTHLPSSHFQQGHRDINWPKCKFKLPVFLHLGVGGTSGDDECAFNTSTQFRVIN